MQQIVDLQNDSKLMSGDVALVSIGTDPVSDLVQACGEYGVTTPLLSDSSKDVSSAYSVLQWAMPSGEPGHTFVLVGMDGKVKWIQDYGATQHGGLMYVNVNELNRMIESHLSSP